MKASILFLNFGSLFFTTFSCTGGRKRYADVTGWFIYNSGLRYATVDGRHPR
jgi:hypothetical protein